MPDPLKNISCPAALFRSPAAARLAVLLVVLSAISLTGCSPIMALSQPGQKDVRVLGAGTPRRALINVLGDPVLVERDAAGFRVDTFRFRQGFSLHEKLLRAAVHGFLDYGTHFIWELAGMYFESRLTGTDVAVRVRYGVDDRVGSVGVLEGGRMIPRRILEQRPARPPPDARADSGGRHASAAAGRDGAGPPDEQVARLEWRGIDTVEVDGRPLKSSAWGNGRTRLAPGRHTIRYGGSYGRSVILGAPTSTVDQTARLELEPGHLYRIRRQRVHGPASAFDVAWVEDAATGKLLHGLRPE